MTLDFPVSRLYNFLSYIFQFHAITYLLHDPRLCANVHYFFTVFACILHHFFDRCYLRH